MQLSHKLRKLSKRGDAYWKVMMLIVVLMISIVILILWMVMHGYFGEEGVDYACKFSSITRLTITGPVGGKWGILPDRCISRPEDVYPTRWSECDPKFGPDSITGAGGDPSRCAAQQIAELAVRCWDMRGRGEGDPSDLECFMVCVHKCKGHPECKDFKVTHGMIKEVIKTTNRTGMDELFTKYIKPDEIVWHEWRKEELQYPEEERDVIRGGETWAILFLDNWKVMYKFEISPDRISVNYKFPCYE